MTRIRSTVTSSALLLLGTFALASCATATPGSRPTTDAPSALSIPACDDLISSDMKLALGGEDAVIETLSIDDVSLEPPIVQDAFADATPVEVCIAGEPHTDFNGLIVVGQGTSEQTTAFATELAADDTMTATDVDGGTLYSGDQTEGIGMGYAVLLVGDVWITVQGPGGESAALMAEDVRKILAEGNPSLAG